MNKIITVTLFSFLILLLAACSGNDVENDIAVGKPAPDFTLISSEGDEVTLSSYKGKPVLLFFHMAGG